MSNRKFDYLVKMIIIGDSGVGKTCLLVKYTQEKFTNSHICTLGKYNIKYLDCICYRNRLQDKNGEYGGEKYQSVDLGHSGLRKVQNYYVSLL